MLSSLHNVMMEFGEWLLLSERTLGLGEEVLSYVEVLLGRVEGLCDPALWRRGYAVMRPEVAVGRSSGVVIHDGGDPLPGVRVEVHGDYMEHRGSYNWDRYERLKGRSGGLIRIRVPKFRVGGGGVVGSVLGWLARRESTVKSLRSTLEHEIVHSLDAGVRRGVNNYLSASEEERGEWDRGVLDRAGFERGENDKGGGLSGGLRAAARAIRNWRAEDRAYMTKTGLGAGAVPNELHPRVWTILRSCEGDSERRELRDWVRRPSGRLPRCMGAERGFVGHMMGDPGLRRLFLRKLSDGLSGNLSGGGTGA